MATIEGQEGPHFYSIFTNLLDFFTVDEIFSTVGLYWVMFAISLFGLIGEPINLIIALYIAIFIMDRSFEEWDTYVEYYGDSENNETYWYLFNFNLYNWLFLFVMLWPDYLIPFGWLINLGDAIGV